MARSGRLCGQDGVTLVELLVSVVVMGVVSLFVTQSILATHKLVRLDDDQARGLADVRTVAERLDRDIRDARAVVCDGAAADPTCANHLQLWIDYNADSVEDVSTERVTWKLQPRGTTGQYDMLRTVGGISQVEARTIVRNVAFGYDVQPQATAPAPGAAHTAVVNVDMTYDAVLAKGSSTRTVSFTGRVRNVS